MVSFWVRTSAGECVLCRLTDTLLRVLLINTEGDEDGCSPWVQRFAALQIYRDSLLLV